MRFLRVQVFYLIIALCCISLLIVFYWDLPRAHRMPSGWVKYKHNPVLGRKLGIVFDLTLLKENDIYRMWFSWRPRHAIAHVESKDGINWSEPVLTNTPHDGWNDVNRPSVISKDGKYHMWYTSQTATRSVIHYAISQDGLNWEMVSKNPVLEPEQSWEKVAVMCPHVIWEEDKGRYSMWYSGGEQHEPNSIGFASSTDGVNWTKLKKPVFDTHDAEDWEKHKVAAGHVILMDGWYYMFYIGFKSEKKAQIGLARSKDGLGNWERHPSNPIISPSARKWDSSAVYKPFALYNESQDRWELWYNGRKKRVEQIGYATLDGRDLGFPKQSEH